MSNDLGSICACGKKRMGLNLTNWNCHLSSCAVAKLKSKKVCSDVTSFFRKSDSKSQNTVLFKKGMYYFKPFYIMSEV